MDGDDYNDADLRECKICGRRFRPDVLQKHQPICQKNANKKRKIFDSGKQRADGSDVPLNKTIKPGQIPKPDPKLATAEARTKQWRQRHEILVESLRAARNYSKAKSTGQPLPPPPPAMIDPSLVQCQYCGRRFNEESSKRHIPFCKEQQSRINPKLNQSKKSTYKVPLPKSKPQNNVSSIPQYGTNGARSRESPTVTQTQNITKPTQRSTPNAAARNGTTNQYGRGAKVGLNKPMATSHQQRGSIGSNNSSSSNLPSRAPPSRKPVGSNSSTSTNNKVSSGTSAGFCHECGSSFSIAAARFCSECGVRRLAI